MYNARTSLFDSIYAFHCILNALLGHIKLFNTVQMYFIYTDCSVRVYQSDFSPLYWHNMLIYYALNYAGIFDGCLLCTLG